MVCGCTCWGWHITLLYIHTKGWESWLIIEENEKFHQWNWNKPWILGEEVILKFLTSSLPICRWVLIFLPGEIISCNSHFVPQLLDNKTKFCNQILHFLGMHGSGINGSWTHTNTKLIIFSILETKLSETAKAFLYIPPPHSYHRNFFSVRNSCLNASFIFEVNINLVSYNKYFPLFDISLSRC